MSQRQSRAQSSLALGSRSSQRKTKEILWLGPRSTPANGCQSFNPRDQIKYACMHHVGVMGSFLEKPANRLLARMEKNSASMKQKNELTDLCWTGYFWSCTIQALPLPTVTIDHKTRRPKNSYLQSGSCDLFRTSSSKIVPLY